MPPCGQSHHNRGQPPSPLGVVNYAPKGSAMPPFVQPGPNRGQTPSPTGCGESCLPWGSHAPTGTATLPTSVPHPVWLSSVLIPQTQSPARLLALTQHYARQTSHWQKPLYSQENGPCAPGASPPQGGTGPEESQQLAKRHLQLTPAVQDAPRALTRLTRRQPIRSSPHAPTCTFHLHVCKVPL